MIKEILKSDVGILNKYFLVTLILVLLTIVGYTSYALFSYEEISTTGIRIKYTGILPQSEGNLSSNWKDKTENEMNYVALYTYGRKNLPNTYKYNNEIYTLNTTIDVSEQEDNSVILGEYTNGSNIIGVIGQDGKVMAPVNSNKLFDDIKNAYVLDISYLDTSNTKYMSYMFQHCRRLTNIDFSKFNTNNVTSMYRMFYGCSDMVYLDLTSFDTTKVTSMNMMFQGSGSLVTVIVGCNWQTATSSDDMFTEALATDVTNVCTSPNGTLASVWKNYTENERIYLALYTINTKTLPNTYSYNGETYTLNKTIDVSERKNKTVFLGEYTSGSNIIGVIGQENGVLAPTNCSKLFDDLNDLTILDLYYFDTSNVTNMSYMFQHCDSVTTLDLTTFDTSKVTTMYRMFYSCNNLTTLDLTSFDTSKVTAMNMMFQDSSLLSTIKVGCNWQEASASNNMFSNCGTSKVTKVCS